MIIFPMAGLSARFTAAGHTLPKYMLPLWGGTVFDRAVGGFSAEFSEKPFLFIVRDIAGTPEFVAQRAAALGIRQPLIAVLDGPTRGQAETVALGIRRIFKGDGVGSSLTIFNIDTFRPGFRRPAGFDEAAADGWLEVFRGSGANWSYVRRAAEDSDRVVEVAEKRPISDLCCTGLYHFRRSAGFLSAFDRAAALSPAQLTGGELYVAPLYNELIAAGADIRLRLIGPEAVIFCGIPAEYEALRASLPPE